MPETLILAAGCCRLADAPSVWCYGVFTILGKSLPTHLVFLFALAVRKLEARFAACVQQSGLCFCFIFFILILHYFVPGFSLCPDFALR